MRRRWLDLLVVNCAGGWRGALVGLAARPWAVWSADDPPPVEVPASGGGVEAEIVGGGGQFDGVVEGSPALPAAGAVDVDVAQGGFSVVELQRQAAAVVRAGDAVFDGVDAAGGDADPAVGHPVAGIDPAEVLFVITAGVGGGLWLNAGLLGVVFGLDHLLIGEGRVAAAAVLPVFKDQCRPCALLPGGEVYTVGGAVRGDHQAIIVAAQPALYGGQAVAGEGGGPGARCVRGKAGKGSAQMGCAAQGVSGGGLLVPVVEPIANRVASGRGVGDIDADAGAGDGNAGGDTAVVTFDQCAPGAVD